MSTVSKHKASRHSYYVTDEVYRELIADFADWATDDRQVEDVAERDQFRRLIEREARILDQLQFESWVDLYTAECLYWVPGTPGGGDPRQEIAVMFDDRRRLEDRIFRLRTGFAWSQKPHAIPPGGAGLSLEGGYALRLGGIRGIQKGLHKARISPNLSGRPART